MLSLQYCKLTREQNENLGEWMGHFKFKANEYGYKGDRTLKENFINGIVDEEIMTEVSRELTAVKENSKVMSEQVLCWARRVEVQNALSEATKETQRIWCYKEGH